MAGTATHFDALRSWLTEIDGEKKASVAPPAPPKPEAKQANESVAGKSSFPDSKIDDGTMPARSGARYAENSADVRKAHANSIDADGGRKAPEENQTQIGLKSSPVGGDPAIEDNYKDRPSGVDGHTASPVDTSVGEKYSFDVSTPEGLAKAAAAMSELSNEILADIVAQANPTEKPAEAKVAAPNTPAAPDANVAQDAGDIAALLGLSKDAADAAAFSTVKSALEQADYLAGRVAQVLQNVYAQKQADAVDGDPAGAGAPPMPAPAEAAAPPAPVEPMPAPAAPDGAAGAGGEEPPGQDQALQELAMALEELGINPEQLAAMATQGGPGAGAEGSPADMGAKIASQVKAFKLSGKFRISEAKNAAERHLRDQMKHYIQQLLGSTRPV